MVLSLLRFDMRAPAFSKATPSDLYAAALDMASFADERGFDGLTLSEHHGTDDGFLSSPLTLAGCMLGRTRRLRVTIAALLAPLYDPVKLAEDLAVLDLASGGRVTAVAGLGYRPEEYAMLGRDFAARGRLLDACLDLLIRAWPGDPIAWQGRTIRLSPRPLTQPRPPVFVGGTKRAGALRAARFGLPFQPAVNDPEVHDVYRRECERRGHEPLLLAPGSGQMIFVSEDPERSWSEVGPHFLHDAMTYAGWQPPGHRSAVHSDATTVEALRAEGKYLILTPDACVERAKAEGAFSVFVHFPLCGGIPPELAWPSLELYADRVLPRLA